MRMAVVAFLALSGVASADKCTGKPRTVSELREQWFGGPEHVWPRRNTTSYDKRTRPNLARRWVAHDINAEAGKPPEAEADPVWSVLQVRIDREGPSTSRGTGLRASSAAILIPNYHASIHQVRELEGLDMKTQTFQLETLVRVFWYDYRLEYGATISTVPEFRVQSLLEPGYRQTGPTSRSQGVHQYCPPDPCSLSPALPPPSPPLRSRVHPTRRS